MYKRGNLINFDTSPLASSVESLSDEDAEVEELGKLFAAYVSTKEKILKKSKDNFLKKYDEVKSKFNELENENKDLKNKVKQLEKKLDDSAKQQKKFTKVLKEKEDIIESLTEVVNNEKQNSNGLQQNISILTKQIEIKNNEIRTPFQPSSGLSFLPSSSASCFAIQQFSHTERRSSGGGGGCGCAKTRCSTMQCGCRKKGISCGSNCRCVGCVN